MMGPNETETRSIDEMKAASGFESSMLGLNHSDGESKFKLQLGLSSSSSSTLIFRKSTMAQKVTFSRLKVIFQWAPGDYHISG